MKTINIRGCIKHDCERRVWARGLQEFSRLLQYCRPGAPTGRGALLISILLAMAIPAHAQIQQAWVAHYKNGITNGTNQAVKMVLDSSGNIYITGFSQNANSNLGYVAIKYAPSGNQVWTSRYDSTNYPLAIPPGFVLDNSNNAIVTGNALTVKY